MAYAFEVVVMLQEFYFYFFSSEGVFSSCAAFAAEQEQFVDGEISLVQYSQELLSYGTACAYYCYFHKAFCKSPSPGRGCCYFNVNGLLRLQSYKKSLE